MHVLVGALQILYKGPKKTEIYVNSATLVIVNMYIFNGAVDNSNIPDCSPYDLYEICILPNHHEVCP